MNPAYALSDVSAVFSPALVLYPELIRRNIERVVEMAGGPERLRPHAKTHKTREITRMEVQRGISKHKCATLAEADLLAECGKHLARYKLPKQFVFRDKIQRSPSGKADYRWAREAASAAE